MVCKVNYSQKMVGYQNTVPLVSQVNKYSNKALQLTTKSGAPIVALLLESTELNR